VNLSIIEKPRGSLEILVHLYRNEKATVTNLVKDAGLNQRTTYSALLSLQTQQLVSQKIVNEFPVHKYYSLTKKGKAVAIHLDSVDKVLSAGK
jgi:DNA-binding HxlR family transcriptional regulator